MSTRTLVAVAIAVAAALAVGGYFRRQDQTCGEWQATFRAEAHVYVADASETIEQVEERQAEVAARLVESKPDGCPIPND